MVVGGGIEIKVALASVMRQHLDRTVTARWADVRTSPSMDCWQLMVVSLCLLAPCLSLRCYTDIPATKVSANTETLPWPYNIQFIGPFKVKRQLTILISDYISRDLALPAI